MIISPEEISRDTYHHSSHKPVNGKTRVVSVLACYFCVEEDVTNYSNEDNDNDHEEGDGEDDDTVDCESNKLRPKCQRCLDASFGTGGACEGGIRACTHAVPREWLVGYDLRFLNELTVN